MSTVEVDQTKTKLKIVSTMTSPLRRRFIQKLQDYLSARHWKAIMPPLWLMGRQALGRPSQWRASGIICWMNNVASFPELSRIYSSIFRVAMMNRYTSLLFQTTFMVRASYLQIYNEVISDLLRSEKTNLKIR
jgi:hypothetical protein